MRVTDLNRRAEPSSTVVTASEARSKLSELVERAYVGEEIIVTKRGEPYARLIKAEDETNSAEPS